MSPAAQRRLATLERQLARYLARPRPAWPAGSREAKRAYTLRLRVIRDNLRESRALREQGHAVGWRWVALTAEDEARARALAE